MFQKMSIIISQQNNPEPNITKKFDRKIGLVDWFHWPAGFQKCLAWKPF